ncbi:hypothetical protein D6745_04585, partial [Candidatus Woesearchaeota archaeon]
MMSDDEKVRKLADRLKKGGLASSEMEAVEKARDMLGITESITKKMSASGSEKSNGEDEKAQATQDPSSPSYDITREEKTLSELMEEGAEGKAAEEVEPGSEEAEDLEIQEEEKQDAAEETTPQQQTEET